MQDDNRSGHIALVAGPWKRRWILATQNMKIGDLITNGAKEQVGGSKLYILGRVLVSKYKLFPTKKLLSG